MDISGRLLIAGFPIKNPTDHYFSASIPASARNAIVPLMLKLPILWSGNEQRLFLPKSFASRANRHELAASTLRNQVIMCRYAAPRGRGDAGHPSRRETIGEDRRLFSVIPLAQTFSAVYPALIFSSL